MSIPTYRNALSLRIHWLVALSCLVVAVTASPASANEPLFVLPTLMSLPLMAAFQSTGWSLLWVTLLEGAVLLRGQRLQPGRALLLAVGANLYSTLFGFGMVAAGVVPILLLPAFGLGAVYLARKLVLLQGAPTNSPALFFNAALGFCLCFLSAWGALLFRSDPAPATVLLFATGFALTFIIEASLLVHDLQEERPRPGVLRTAFWMNMASYAVLVTSSGPALYQQALNAAGITARQRLRAKSCQANLKQIQSAKDRWALEHQAELAPRLGVKPKSGASPDAALRDLRSATSAPRSQGGVTWFQPTSRRCRRVQSGEPTRSEPWGRRPRAVPATAALIR